MDEIPVLTSADRRTLKSRAQRLDPLVYVGKQGLTDAIVAGTVTALATHELVKVRFTANKEDRATLAEEIAARSGASLVTVVGHVAVIFKPKPKG